MIKELEREALSERLPKEVVERVYEDIDAASMCWTDLINAGIFEADIAASIAFELCHYIADLMDETAKNAAECERYKPPYVKSKISYPEAKHE